MKRIQELICRRFDFEKILCCCITPQVRTLQGSPEMIMTKLVVLPSCSRSMFAAEVLKIWTWISWCPCHRPPRAVEAAEDLVSFYYTLICLSRIEVFLVNPTCNAWSCEDVLAQGFEEFPEVSEVSFSHILRALVHQVRLISGCWCDGQSSSVAFRNDTMVTMISRMPRDHVERPGLSGFSWSCRRKVYVKTNMRRKTKWVLCKGCKPGRFRQQKRVGSSVALISL